MLPPHQAGAEPSASLICPQQLDALCSSHTCRGKAKIILPSKYFSNIQIHAILYIFSLSTLQCRFKSPGQPSFSPNIIIIYFKEHRRAKNPDKWTIHNQQTKEAVLTNTANFFKLQ